MTKATTKAANENGNGTAIALATNDALAGLELAPGMSDGLEEIDSSDYKIPALVLNTKATDSNGRSIPADKFFNTVDETAVDTVDAALCLLHKTNMWSVRDDATGKSEIKCRSFDRIQGTMDNGTIRPCEGCPDAKWRTDEKTGKRKKNCDTVFNVFAVDRSTNMPFVIRFKKTSTKEIESHLQKHHLGRRLIAGKRFNYPLYSFAVKISAKMKTKGKDSWAVPVLEKGATLAPDEIEAHAANTTELKKSMRSVLERIETQAEARSAVEDTSFDTDKYGDQEGQDFVESAG